MSWFRRRPKLDRFPKHGLKLHLGSGTVRLDGWINIDLETEADLNLDLREGLPFLAGAARLIYNEHVIEHITVDEGRRCLADWYRVLEPGGVLRIATPDLEYVVERYHDAWRDQAWLQLPEYAFIKTRAEMMNVSFRWWGHQYLYDGEELERRLRDAGFSSVRRCGYGESTVAELAGLETRPDSKLIMEAVRP
ncbi:MAG: methyltransferase domain-containing protein [Gemmatimonadales bacterium]|nr:methyltransferase domain-containing protein [Gemmatimonadales bacterium]